MANISRFTLDFGAIKHIFLTRRFYLWFIPTLFVLQGAYTIGYVQSEQVDVINAENQIKQRIAMDLTHNFDVLPIYIEDGTEGGRYLAKLNKILIDKHYPIRVVGVEVSATAADPELRQYNLVLTGINNDTYIIVVHPPISLFSFISLWPFFIAIFIASIYIFYSEKTLKNVAEERFIDIDPCRLKIDLHQKVLVNPVTGVQVALANKPLCFYASLVEYCLKYPEKSLNPNKDLPDEFSQLCRKYFSRLIELGHTIRKRPNFASNLEKTLSEIRAALDELYGDDIKTKDYVYPKKAVGEGSRSKAHNFALTEINQEVVKVLGS
ncbi:hypothetical protein KO525_05015 [Psychrosphaera sp. B3R10]|uniref:Uncharacterized protein n=1 Tax=Psychrosphaera algicola TaxID=3023714 RepID=A0ABT5FCW7_9GAMM|nr:MULTISPECIES: hypothetical protein [unclassified Psychrosphaera]MBU2883873.1 hypothetical protein [Psychrosphaera sp. I2R16]MBU2988736.1 hypothetical protein [Psychrosphaera sp. B3R10]MDC2888442.1 hypothetical protein [Psychrosphaera sp. G1-22]